MKTKEIIKDNQLIAVFMEWEEAGTDGMYDFPEGFNDPMTEYYDCIPPNSMKFHSSWDWLMPVMEKIELLGSQTFKDINVTVYSRFEIEHIHIKLHWSKNHNYQLFLEVLPEWKEGRNCGISKEYKRVGIPKNSTKLEAMWIAVVEFINWYNKQN